jgi:hypothetical protein
MKQYVNFDQNNEDLPRHEGARMHLRVTRKLWTGTFEGWPFTDAQSRRLEWEVVADNGNIATNIVCAMSQSAKNATLAMKKAKSGLTPDDTRTAAPKAPVLGQKITSEREEDGHFTNTVTLPHTGGDKFTINAYKLDKNGDRTDVVVKVRDVETWRRIYYDFYSANKACKTLYDNIKDRLSSYFAGGFVEMVENRVGTVQDTPVTLVSMISLFQGKAQLNHDPNHIRLGIVDQWGRTKVATIDMPATDSKQGADAAATATCSYDGNSMTWSFRIRLQQRSVFPNASYLKSFKVAQEQQLGGYAELQPGSNELGPAYTVVRGGDDDVTVTVASAAINSALTIAARPCRAELKVSYNQLLGGSSGGKNIVITRKSLFDKDGTSGADAGVLIAFLHEIGHSIGMTDTSSPSFYFDDNGGRGPHCSTSADLVGLNTDRWNEVPRDQTISGSVYLPNVGGNGQCVMYHSRWTNMKNAVFCQDCIDALKKMKISVK